MVTISGYQIRKSSREGKEKEFIVLELQGGVEMVQSQTSGQHYATVRKATISSTFDEATAKSLVGSKYPGSIVRQSVDSYDFVVKETGEIIKLAHSWVYSPEESNIALTPSRGREVLIH